MILTSEIEESSFVFAVSEVRHVFGPRFPLDTSKFRPFPQHSLPRDLIPWFRLDLGEAVSDFGWERF